VRPTADQLTFELEPRAPRLPTDLRPMLARPSDQPFDDPGWLYEPSWDGLRVLAHVEDGHLRLVDARGRDVTVRFPDLLSLIDAVNGAPCVLDGEIVVPDAAGMPDPDALRRRLRPESGEGGRGHDRSPATYLMNDLLVQEGRPLLPEPLERRRRSLATAVRPAERAVVVPAIAGEGRTLFDAIAAQGLPAMLARRADSPYLSGVRSDLWRLVRVARRFEAVVGGYSPRPDGSLALLLGAWEQEGAEERFVAVGAAEAPAGGGLTVALERTLRRLEDDVTPFRRGARADYRWVRPELVVTVEHRGWADRRLLEPRLVAIRDELDARGCRVPAVSEPGSDAGEEVRRPVLALLQRLPLGDD
jgi:bifunctional non-homologous end joining protein LigD